MLQNPCKTMGFNKNIVYKIPPGGGGGRSETKSVTKRFIVLFPKTLTKLCNGLGPFEGYYIMDNSTQFGQSPANSSRKYVVVWSNCVHLERSQRAHIEHAVLK